MTHYVEYSRKKRKDKYVKHSKEKTDGLNRYREKQKSREVT